MILTKRRLSLFQMVLTGAILILLLSVNVVSSGAAPPNDLLITGVVDGPLSGGVPKVVELYAINAIPDLSIYGLGSANNGGGTDGEEFTFPAVSVDAETCIWIAAEEPGFTAFFGFAPNYTSGALFINGDDAIELFVNGSVSDVFGDINVDGSGQPWEYSDGWAYRDQATGPDGNVFVPGNWSYSGPNALDGETTNATAATPFPTGTYPSSGPCTLPDPPPPPPPPPPPSSDVIINEVDADQVSTDSAEFVELYDGGIGNTDLTGLSLVFYNGSDDASYQAFDLDGRSTDGDGYFVLCGDAANVANCDYDVYPNTNLIQNGADAVALVVGDAVDFPTDTPVSTSNLIDALVYDTSDGDDAGLLVLLNAGQPQINERGGGDGTGHSNQRCPDGSGGARNTDTYAQYAPTPGEENICVVPVIDVKIHEVQGAGSASPLVGQTVAIEGIVVGDFQDDVGVHGDLNGFFVQEEDADIDGDPLTSEGVFVFQGSNPVVDLVIGDQVRVEGSVSEFFDMTQITSFSGVSVISSGNPLPAASIVTLPVTAVSDFEAYEGMYVTFPQALVISEYYNFDRFGEIVLTADRQFQPTAVFEPGSVDAANLALANSLSRITLDDGRTFSNPDPAIHPNGLEFNLTNLFRGGDTVADVTGVINYGFGLYRVQPTQGAVYTAVNARPASPDPVGGNVTVAAFNVLNYFTTLDAIQDSSSSNDPADDVCGPLADQECRGADNATEFTRQRDKIITAIAEINADVVGLMEIENHPTDAALADLVSGLNDAMGAGTYEYVATGPVGPDVIRVAFIYKPASVSPLGGHAVLDTAAFLDPNNLGDAKNRAALAQTFSVNSTGGVFTAVVNHLKSKGSRCGAGDDDPEQGSCNLTRTLAAQELLNWLATDPTGSVDEDFMIIGDLNAYDKEDPIDVFAAGGYTDLAYQFEGEYAYSYVFSGQWGYLDYALANAALFDEVAGATVWHINADEADLIDYDTSFKRDAQDAIYAPDAYRSSDHDPVLVGLELTTEAEIFEMMGVVQGLVDEGWLNGGQGNSLLSKLENILAKLGEGKTKPAVNQLGAFINELEDFVSEGLLTPEQAEPLIKSAEVIVSALGD